MDSNIKKREKLQILLVTFIIIFSSFSNSLSYHYYINNEDNISKIQLNNDSSNIRIKTLTTETKHPYRILSGDNGKDLISSDFIPDKNAKLGFLLQNKVHSFLKNNNEYYNDPIPLLIVFRKDTSEIDKLFLLKELNWDTHIIKLYNIISAVLIKVNIRDFLSKLPEITPDKSISKIFLDTNVNIDDFTEVNPSSSSNSNDNWWTETIGSNNLNYDGHNVNIAILDTGISKSHSDLALKSPNTIHRSFVEGLTDSSDINGHGTHVAGIAAGTGDSSQQIYEGIAPGARLFNLKVANSSGEILTSDVISAVEWSVSNNIDIISMSFGAPYPEVINPETIALNEATKNGIVTIASVGNSGPYFYTGGTPAAGLSVISVGAIDRNKNLIDFSSVGPSSMRNIMPDILAPGVNIISTEEKSSLISNQLRYTGKFISGNNINSDYIPLSGTSMSAPMVAGAIALILEAFPDLTPEGVRIALYKGAYEPNSMGKGDNGVGAGIINVTASINWLMDQPDPYALIGLFPNSLPYAPFDLISYPGDYQYYNISIFSSSLDFSSINITIPNIDGIEITSNRDQISFNNHSSQDFFLGVKIQSNASQGERFGIIEIIDSISGVVYDKIEISINVSFPKGRILFDSFHGLNDLSDWPTSYKQIDIYNSMKDLHLDGFKIDYKMENWTFGYDPNYDSQILSSDRVMLSDIVVLQTPILPYNEYEIEILKEFVNSGGSILVLGTKSQYLSLSSINNLLENLNSNIIINNDNIIDYEDLGIGIILNEKIINGSNLNTNSIIFEPDDSFKFLFGPSLDVQNSENTYTLASIDDKAIVAAKSGEDLGKGNIVVWSDYQWLQNQNFIDTKQDLTHKQILLNLFDFLNTRNKNNISIQANFNATVTNSSSLSLDISVLNSTSKQPINDLIPGISINVTLTEPNENIKIIQLNNSINNGIYFNSSINLDYSDYHPYKATISILKNSIIFEKSYNVFKISSSDEVVIEGAVIEKTKLNRTIGNSNKIEIFTPKIYSSLNITLFGSLATTNIFNSKPSEDTIYHLNNSSPTIYQTDFIIDGSENSGNFIFYTIGNISTPDMHFFNFKSRRIYFTVINNAPIIDEISSLINNIKFEDTNDDDSYYINEVSNTNPVSISLKTEEKVNYEDKIENLSAVMAYFTITTSENSSTIIFPNLIPKCELEFSEQLELFGCDFNIPSSLSYNGTNFPIEKSQQSSMNPTYVSLLWLTVRDSEGASTDYIFLVYVNVVLTIEDFIDYVPVIILFVIVIAVIVIIYYKSKPKKNEFSEFYDYDLDNYGNRT